MSTVSSKAFFLLMFSGVVIGCTGERSTPNTDSSMSANTPSVQGPAVAQPKVRAPSELSPHAAQLADAVQQSQARLASSRSDVCPKLIEFKVGDTTNFRQNEKMRNQSCKYFIYPSTGDKISVTISNPKMKAEMVQPKYFSFVDDVFVVSKTGKHVLQIAYKDYHGSRPAESYDLTVSTR